MPATMQEARIYMLSAVPTYGWRDPNYHRHSLAREFLDELLEELGEAITYGPTYRRAAWDAFTDAIVFARMGSFIEAGERADRARVHAGLLSVEEYEETYR